MWPFDFRRSASSPSPDSDSAELLRQRVVAIRGPLDDQQATTVIASMLYLQHESPRVHLTLLIDSPGGSVTAGMAVIDTIRSLAPPVQTCCHGAAHGIAAIILACGQRGERVVVHGSSLSLTPVISAEVEASSANLERTQLLLAGIVADASGRAVESVAEDMAAGRSFDPASAVEYGLADRVVK
jgi:ATP-dependent Clp protease, protease subunit